jgi:hypothetical protein
MMPRGGTYAVLASALEHDGCDAENLTGYRFRSHARALAAGQKLREQHPGACVAYWPTRAELRRIDAKLRAAMEWAVTYWQIWRPGGELLSPIYANKDQGRRALEHFQREHVDAFLLEYHEEFECASDLAEHAALLAALAPIAS